MRQLAHATLTGLLFAILLITPTKDTYTSTITNESSHTENILDHAINLQGYPVTNSVTFQKNEIILHATPPIKEKKKKSNNSSIP